MKAHQSKNFMTILKICSFFKNTAKSFQYQFDDAIRLMTIDQLYANIMHEQEQTVLMKSIIIFLLDKIASVQVRNKRTCNQILGFYLFDNVEIREKYYNQIALQQYSKTLAWHLNVKQFSNKYKFCQLDISLKFKLLNFLTRKASESIKKLKVLSTKEEEENQKQTKQHEQDQEKQKKYIKNIVLGEDGHALYLYAPFLPNFVICHQDKKLALLNREQVCRKIQQLFDEQMSEGNLYLIKSLTNLIKILPNSPPQTEPIVRIQQIKSNSPKLEEQKSVEYLKQRLFDINKRYQIYLQNFNHRKWGYLKQRQQYVTKLQQSNTFEQIINAYKHFYSKAHQYLFICLCDDQQAIPLKNCSEYYKNQHRPTCNIITISLTKNENSPIADLSTSLFNHQFIDHYAALHLIVCLLQKAMVELEDKARRYYAKRQKLQKMKQLQHQKYRKQIQEENKVKPSFVGRLRAKPQRKSDSLDSNNIIRKKKHDLRPRVTKKKMYGVAMIDSDDQSYEENTSECGTLDKYHYKTRNSFHNK